MSTLAISSFASPATLFKSVSKLIVALAAFTKYQDLVLRTLSLAINSHVSTNHVKTIWIHEQAFLLWSEVWK